jgi:hypothetical protein
MPRPYARTAAPSTLDRRHLRQYPTGAPEKPSPSMGEGLGGGDSAAQFAGNRLVHRHNCEACTVGGSSWYMTRVGGAITPTQPSPIEGEGFTVEPR